jgi:hypothetical protein
MLDNAKVCGLAFDSEAIDRCFTPKPFMPLGVAHDEWKMIPWGPPKHRVAPANAALSNTRLSSGTKGPEGHTSFHSLSRLPRTSR